MNFEKEIEKLVITLSCPDRPGIVHAITGVLVAANGNILESQEYNDAESGGFFVRIEAAVPGGKMAIYDSLKEVATRYQMDFHIANAEKPLKTLIMVSKEAHCLSDLLTKQHEGRLPIDVVAVVGNHETLKPIAEFYNTEFIHIPVTKETKLQAEKQLLEIVTEREVELVILARYMQILSSELCTKLAGNIINIHHSFLPSFKGARPYAQAHNRGVKLIGATAHYVTSDLDEGPIIEQDVVRVAHNNTPASLAAKGAEVERQVLSRAVQWHGEHRILMNGNRTVVFS